MSSDFKVEVLSKEEAGPYGELTVRCPHTLAQQTLEWSEVISPLSPDTPWFLVAKGAAGAVVAGLPLYHFKGPLGGVLTSVPHAGPLGGVLSIDTLTPEEKKSVYELLIGEALVLAEKLDCVSLTIITNPFDEETPLYQGAKEPNYIFNNFTQAIDLESLYTESGAYNTGKSRWNNHVNKNLGKARRAGLTVDWGDESDFKLWYNEIHCKRHAELGAEPLPEDLLSSVLKVMAPAKKGGLAVVRKEDRIVGGCFYIWGEVIADAFIMSADSDYFELGANHALTDFSARYFHSLGIKWFNWQSCKRDSGVFRFKRRWGSTEFTYRFLTWTLPGFDRPLEAGVKTVAEGYPWHYVAPFEALEGAHKSGTFDKT